MDTHLAVLHMYPLISASMSMTVTWKHSLCFSPNAVQSTRGCLQPALGKQLLPTGSRQPLLVSETGHQRGWRCRLLQGDQPKLPHRLSLQEIDNEAKVRYRDTSLCLMKTPPLPVVRNEAFLPLSVNGLTLLCSTKLPICLAFVPF